jgi:formate hydrogenlyase subunit 6/NADH:ubiquinone oxidoreductase subunit I
MNTAYILRWDDFENLMIRLRSEGYQTIGPIVRSQAIVLDTIQGPDDLPLGWQDRQQAGGYRLHQTDAATLFGYSLGPHTWKKYLYPPDSVLCQIQHQGTGWQATPCHDPVPAYAFVGIRACEIEALFILDRVLSEGPFCDPFYREARKKAFILAVNCTQPGGTCFCASMQTGPKVQKGFDIVLTEIPDQGPSRLIAEAGSVRGENLLNRLNLNPAGLNDRQQADILCHKAKEGMGHRLPRENLRALFYDFFDHPHWETLETRCLACGNCTLVCPTCFCHSIMDANRLDGRQAERRRKWDSCFSQEFAYIHGGSLRTSVKARYRQWLTHKLVTWVDQFGTCGCVGCGRCITWCPAGIDLTLEAQSFDSDPSMKKGESAPCKNSSSS